mmetsp:Transcript_15932/g.40560  ORF Transcript_15932/g.40560 Transcript_15932/m.40560 type:complete len:267 (-) Transcript_15932:461-1261(-)
MATSLTPRPPGSTGPVRSTTKWSPSENTLRHESFNAIVDKKQFDPTEVLMSNASMSKQAMLGRDWAPSGIAARRAVEQMQANTTSGAAEAFATSLASSGGGFQTTLRSATPRTSRPPGVVPRPPGQVRTPVARGPPSRPWTAMEIPAPLSARGVVSAGATAMGGEEGRPESAPVTWRTSPMPVHTLRDPSRFTPRETSLSRESYNSIVCRGRLDFNPTAVMIHDANLARKEVLGAHAERLRASKPGPDSFSGKLEASLKSSRPFGV